MVPNELSIDWPFWSEEVVLSIVYWVVCGLLVSSSHLLLAVKTNRLFETFLCWLSVPIVCFDRDLLDTNRISLLKSIVLKPFSMKKSFSSSNRTSIRFFFQLIDLLFCCFLSFAFSGNFLDTSDTFLVDLREVLTSVDLLFFQLLLTDFWLNTIGGQISLNWSLWSESVFFGSLLTFRPERDPKNEFFSFFASIGLHLLFKFIISSRVFHRLLRYGFRIDVVIANLLIVIVLTIGLFGASLRFGTTTGKTASEEASEEALAVLRLDLFFVKTRGLVVGG